MSRHAFIGAAVLLALVDIAIHLHRSLAPSGNPFASPLHQQFFLYCVVAFLLVAALVTAPRWLGNQAWLASAALMVWELGAIGVWLIAYHAPNPPGVVPDEGYVSKVIEALVIVLLLATLRLPRAARQAVSSPS